MMHAFAEVCKQKQRRRSWNKQDQMTVGEAAEKARAAYAREHGVVRGWLNSFLQNNFDIPSLDSRVARAARNEVRSARRAYIRGLNFSSQQKGVRRACYTSVVTAKARRRNRGAGRRPKAQELHEELWHWFVDRLDKCPARINTNLLIAQAEVLRQDLIEQFNQKKENGEVDANATIDLPVVDAGFVQRWRRAYGVTYRTVNLRYKVSDAKRRDRLRVFWCNIIRIRAFHQKLFGPDRLRFVNFDQKPLWFNTCHMAATLARRGSKKVSVKENMIASRERFTFMSNCPSWRTSSHSDDKSCLDRVAEQVDDRPGLKRLVAVMFNVAHGNGSRIRARLQSPVGSILQFSPRGSYRLEHTLHFLDEVLETVAGAADCIVVLLDWFAPHLDVQVDALCHGKNHAVLRLGGGITGDVQVPDTHRHGPLSRAYKDLETADGAQQLLLRPWSLPSCSRQTVMDRAVAAWKATPCPNHRQEYVQNAIMNSLDGSEDIEIRADLQNVWRELRMPERRAQILREIDDEFSSGALHTWSQYPDLLEPYDDHDPIPEGEEGFEVQLLGGEEQEAPPGGDGSTDSDADIEGDHESVDVPEDIRKEEELMDMSDEHMNPPVAGASVLQTSSLLVSKECQDAAKKELEKEYGGPALNALIEAAQTLRGAGEIAHAQTLEEAVRSRIARNTKLSHSVRVYLRAKTLQRQAEQAVAQAAARDEDRRVKNLEHTLKIAKEQAKAARSEAEVEKTKTKRALEEIRLKKSEVELCKQSKMDLDDSFRQHLCAFLLHRCGQWLAHESLGKTRVAALEKFMATYAAKKKTMASPRPWPDVPLARAGFVDVSVHTMFDKGKKCPRNLHPLH